MIDELTRDDLMDAPPSGPPRPPRPPEPRRPDDDEPRRPPKPMRLAVPVWEAMHDHLSRLLRTLDDELLTLSGLDADGSSLPLRGAGNTEWITDEFLRDIEAEPLLAALGHLLRAERLLWLGRADGEKFRQTEQIVDGKVLTYGVESLCDNPSMSVTDVAERHLEFVRETGWVFGAPGKGPSIWPWMEKTRRRALAVRELIGPVADAAAWRAKAVALRGELIDRGFVVEFDIDGNVCVTDGRSTARIMP